MTYSTGGTIQATDYNGFANDTGGANVNGVWGTGSGDRGWGQTALGTVSASGTVTATQWADLVNRISSMGSQTGTSITARSAPTAGQTISVLSAISTDLTNITTNRGSAAASGTVINSWTGTASSTGGYAKNGSGWTITFTQTVTFGSADQARYFWNAGGLIRLDMSKTSTGADKDPDWNTLAGQVGTIWFSGRVNGAAQTIAGTSYTGTTRTGGTGGTQTTLATTTGWYSLTAGAAATTIFQLNDATSPYSGDYIRITAAKSADSTSVVFTTTWVDNGSGSDNSISGGTATNSSFSSFGTAPAVIARVVTPSTTYLSNTWGTPSVALTASQSSALSVDYLVVGGGGGGWGPTNVSAPAGGAGGYNSGSQTWPVGASFGVTVGGGGVSASSAQNGTNSKIVSSALTNDLVGAGGGHGGYPGGAGGSGGASGGAGLAGQGYAGGGESTWTGGGGGGANGVGSNASYKGQNGYGGPGKQWLDGNYYAGGGGGGNYTTGAQVAGGVGGGGNGGGRGAGQPGGTNTGGGGGGAASAYYTYQYGGVGGSGVVIIRYAGSTRATGGSISSAGGYTYHTFTSNGTFTITS